MNRDIFLNILTAGILGAALAVLIFEIIHRLISKRTPQPNDSKPATSNLIIVPQAKGLGMAAGVVCVFLVGASSTPSSSVTVVESRIITAAATRTLLGTHRE